MLPDRVSNPGPLTYESGALPIALPGPASGSAYVTNGGRDGMMSTAGLELPYPQVFQAKFRDKTSRRVGSNVTFVKR